MLTKLSGTATNMIVVLHPVKEETECSRKLFWTVQMPKRQTLELKTQNALFDRDSCKQSHPKASNHVGSYFFLLLKSLRCIKMTLSNTVYKGWVETDIMPTPGTCSPKERYISYDPAYSCC